MPYKRLEMTVAAYPKDHTVQKKKRGTQKCQVINPAVNARAFTVIRCGR